MFRSHFPAASLCCLFLVANPIGVAQDAPANRPDEKPAAAAVPDLGSFLKASERTTFERVLSWTLEGRHSLDPTSTIDYLFDTARQHAWEGDLLEVTEQVAADTELPQRLRDEAEVLRMLALAEQGKWEEAVTHFETKLRQTRLRNPDPALDLAFELAEIAQLQSKPDLAGSVLTKVSEHFFLNAMVRNLVERRLRKLDLFGKPAPAISVTALSGETLTIPEDTVTIVDFWATNCPPCLVEIPRLRQLRSRHGADRLQILGISLDDSPVPVEQMMSEMFTISWPIALSLTDDDTTRARYRAPTIPSLFVIDRTGKIVGVDIHGPRLERLVDRLEQTDGQ